MPKTWKVHFFLALKVKIQTLDTHAVAFLLVACQRREMHYAVRRGDLVVLSKLNLLLESLNSPELNMQYAPLYVARSFRIL